MKTVFRQTQLYKFLSYCNDAGLEKKVLDCGAGGNCPPLALFLDHGYKTLGIELDYAQINEAKAFEEKNKINLNISKGDIRKLPFQDGYIPYVYSYNTIFHMSKREMGDAINEIKRVLKVGGLCFINVLSTEDFRRGEGKALGNNEFLQEESGTQIVHSYFETNECEKYFTDLHILYKETRIVERLYEGKMIKQGFVDYILKKMPSE